MTLSKLFLYKLYISVTMHYEYIYLLNYNLQSATYRHIWLVLFWLMSFLTQKYM